MEDGNTVKHCHDYNYLGINISDGGTLHKGNKNLLHD